MKMLNELIENAPAIPVENLAQDSRKVRANTMFFCIKGQRVDGHNFATVAAQSGASVVVHSDPVEKQNNVVYIQVEDTMKAMNEIADKFYDRPSQKLKMIGVTGTNGKSTTSYVAYQILNRLDKKTGYIGTIDVQYAGKSVRTDYTTPESIELQRLLGDMVDCDVEACCMEVSSNGLEWHRVDAVKFDVAIFTNLTWDHLDVHGTMENYCAAKAKLFAMLGEGTSAIINIDDPYAPKMMEANEHGKLITYSLLDESATFFAKDIKLSFERSEFTLVHEGKEYDVKTNLVASFNIANLVAAIAAVYALGGYSLEDIIAQCADFDQVKGRVEAIDEGQPFKVIVDYAHTPDGMEKILPFARECTPRDGKVIAVFGSAGGRDTKKRPTMGEIADKYCDIIILTEDDYRNEDPKEIADEIKSGIKHANTIFFSQRQTAISQAIELAGPQDTVVIMGKGQDSYMAVGNEKQQYPGDHTIARKILKQRMEECEDDQWC